MTGSRLALLASRPEKDQTTGCVHTAVRLIITLAGLRLAYDAGQASRMGRAAVGTSGACGFQPTFEVLIMSILGLRCVSRTLNGTGMAVAQGLLATTDRQTCDQLRLRSTTT